MASFNFTQESISNAPLGFHYDSNKRSFIHGARLRCRVGKKSTTFYFKKGSKILEKIGEFPAISVNDARNELLRLALEFQGDNDKVARKIKLANNIATLQDGVQQYLDDWLIGKPSHQTSLNLYKRRIKDSFIGKKPMDEISKQDALVYLKKLENTKSRKGGFLTTDVNRVRQLCSAAFRFAQAGNEVLDAKSNPFGFKNTVVVSSDEAENALDDSALLLKIVDFVYWGNFSDEKKGIYLVSLFTGQHNTEMGRMKWNQISDDGQWWKFTNYKNKARAHKVFLHPTVRDFIYRFGNLKSEYVFNNTTRVDFSKLNPAINKMLKAEGYNKTFNSSHHRASIGTFLDDNDFPNPEIMLGHTPKATFRKHYRKVKDESYIEAFTMWAKHILGDEKHNHNFDMDEWFEKATRLPNKLRSTRHKMKMYGYKGVVGDAKFVEVENAFGKVKVKKI